MVQVTALQLKRCLTEIIRQTPYSTGLRCAMPCSLRMLVSYRALRPSTCSAKAAQRTGDPGVASCSKANVFLMQRRDLPSFQVISLWQVLAIPIGFGLNPKSSNTGMIGIK